MGIKAPLTQAQIDARKAAEAFFGDLLAPTPKAPRKAAATKKPLDKMWGGTHASRPLVIGKSFHPTLRIHRITTQVCTTCGSVHKYTGTAIVRFDSIGRRDGLAIETPMALPLHEALDLPHTVEHVEEQTPVCATCIETCTMLDAILSQQLPKPYTQMELFI